MTQPQLGSSLECLELVIFRLGNLVASFPSLEGTGNTPILRAQARVAALLPNPWLVHLPF